MTERHLPFYRSPITRYTFVVTGAFLSYALSPYAPVSWHDTPSLRFLHSVLPYWVMAGGFVIYTLLLFGPLICVIVADALGLAMYLTELVALFATIRVDRPTNPWTLAGILLAVVLHFVAMRLAIFDKEAA